MLKTIICALTLISNAEAYEFNDSHVHLTNYVQEGTDINKFLDVMGDTVGRSVLFGIPLQQQWSHRISGEHAPKYYLETDAHLYYYSFTDAQIAMAYKSLSDEKKKRFDPMITGFNPTDMYGADHIKRVLKTFPGVFVGIGEFTIHKEFVSSKVAGDVASLTDRALYKILDFAGETGLVVLLHNDFHAPFPKEGDLPVFYFQMTELLKQHSKTTIIWAHTGLGRIIQPFEEHKQALDRILKNPAYSHVYFDISWDEVAKYIVSSPKVIKNAAAFMEKYPDRFLFGTDEVAPKEQEKYMKVYNIYKPLWDSLTPKTKEMVTKKNYERLFDRARLRVRDWEKKNL